MKSKWFQTNGLSLLSLPVTKTNRVNNRARGVMDLGLVSGAQLLQVAGYSSNGPLLFCGCQNKALSIIRQAAFSACAPFLLIGTRRSLSESSFLSLGPDWTHTQASPNLPEGNGCLVLQPGQTARLELKESLSEWYGRYLILLLGNGLQLDSNDLDLLNAIGSYAIVTDSVPRSFSSSNEMGVSINRVFASMDLIVCQDASASVKELVSILPTYQQIKTVNTVDYSSFRNGSSTLFGIPMRGKGVRISQSRSEEVRPLLEESQITAAIRTGRTVIVSIVNSCVWIADY